MSQTESATWQSIAISDTGRVRDHNEDAFMSRNDIGHWAVADGMGGHEAGEVASNNLVQAIEPLEIGEHFSNFVDQLEDSLITVNNQLRILAGSGDKIIGTTVAGLVLYGSHYFIYWCGDSRVYLLRDNKLSQQTIDHTYTQQLVEAGEIKPEEAKFHPEGNVITRAVGAADELFVDMDLRNFQRGDLFLISSDGLDKELDDREIEAILNQDLDLQAKADLLMSSSLDRGGRDNTTLILVQA